MRKFKKGKFLLVWMLIFAMIVAGLPVGQVQAGTLTYVSDGLSTSAPSQSTGVEHTITFRGTTNIATVNTLQVTLPSTSWMSGAGTLTATGYSQTVPFPVTALPGTLVANVDINGVISITGITVGLLATTTYGVRLQSLGASLYTPAAVGVYGVGIESRVTAAIQDTQTARVAIIASVGVSADVSSSLSFSIDAVASGLTVAGEITDVASTSTTVPFGTLTAGTHREAAHGLTVATNASNGFTVKAKQSADLTSGSDTIAAVTATNTTPAVWPTVSTGGRFGYHALDAVLGTGTTTRFAVNDTFAQFSTTAYEVSFMSGPTASNTDQVLYKVEVANNQPAGSYSNTINYMATPVF